MGLRLSQIYFRKITALDTLEDLGGLYEKPQFTKIPGLNVFAKF
jgi:hypothetical protein